MKIFINTPSWLIGTNTDYNLKREMGANLKDYKDLEFIYPKYKIFSVGTNLKKISNYLVRKIVPKRKSPYGDGFIAKRMSLYGEIEFLLKKRKCDIIYSQGTIPKRTYGKPIFLDLFFIEPHLTDMEYSHRANKNFEKMKDIIRQLAYEPGIYNLRSNHSLNLIKQFVPEQFHYKFRNLYFLQPHLKAISLEELEKKINKKTSKILFCGAQANRKGLPLLIESFLEFISSSSSHYELHIISSLSDGSINIPNHPNIFYHGSKTYSETQLFFKDCDIYCMPSVHESFGITYVEAMANGLIVMARNFEPQREIVDNGRCGFLVDLTRESLLNTFKKIESLSVQEKKKLLIDSRNRFLKYYDFNVVKENWHQAFIDCHLQSKRL